MNKNWADVWRENPVLHEVFYSKKSFTSWVGHHLDELVCPSDDCVGLIVQERVEQLEGRNISKKTREDKK